MKYLALLLPFILLVACGVEKPLSNPNFELKGDTESTLEKPYTITVEVGNNKGELIEGKVYAEIDMLDMDHGSTLPLISRGDGIFEQEYAFSMTGKWEIIFHYIYDYETYKSDPYIIDVH